MLTGEVGAVQESFRYWAFISYSHDDRGWARWLHRKLESYRVPRRLVGRRGAAGAVPRRLYPIFRDRDELPSSADLGGVVHRALRESRFLIVICSNRSAGSRWVNEEVEAFKKLGREDRVLCFKIGDDSPGCFAPALLQHYDADGAPTGRATEPLAADAAPGADGREGALIKLIAGMLGVGYDELRRRERRRRLLQNGAAACAALALVGFAAAGWHWQQLEKRAALAAQALDARIAQLYENGRGELLAHNEIRAAVLLGEAYRLGVHTPAMRLMLGRAMRIVDAEQIRIPTPSPESIVAISPDARQTLGIDAQHHLRVFDVATGAERYKIDLGSDTGGYWASYGDAGKVIWTDTDHEHAPQRRLQIFDARSGAQLAQYELITNNDVSMTPLDDADERVTFIAPDHSISLAPIGGRVVRVAGDFTTAGFCRGSRDLLAARSDGVIERRDGVTGALLARYQGLRGQPSMLASSDGCELIAAGSMSGVVRVWDRVSGEVLMSGGHVHAVMDLHFNHDGTRLMSLTRSAVGIWNGRSGGLIYSGRFLDPNSNLAAMRPDGAQLGRLADGRLSILGPLSGLDLFSLGGHNGTPLSFSFDGSGRHLVSGSGDGEIIVWNLPKRLRATTTSGEPATFSAPFAFAPQGRQVFVSDRRGGGRLTTLDALDSGRPLVTARGALRAARFSPDGQMLATVANAPAIIDITSLHTQAAPLTLPAQESLIKLLDYDPGGRYLAALPEADYVDLYDLHNGAALTRFERDQTRAYAFAPHASQFAIGAHGQVRMWDLQRRRWRWQITLPLGEEDEHKVNLLAFSPDGRYLLATALRQDMFLLDAQSGRILKHVSAPASAFFSIAAFSRDGRQVVVADWARCSLLWRFSDNRVLTLSGHTAPVRAASFSHDDALVLTAGEDGIVKLWDAANGGLLDSFAAHDGAIVWDRARFTPDDRGILSSGADGLTRLWELPRETRTPAAIAARLACSAPWQIDGDTLVPRRVDDATCKTALH